MQLQQISQNLTSSFKILLVHSVRFISTVGPISNPVLIGIVMKLQFLTPGSGLIARQAVCKLQRSVFMMEELRLEKLSPKLFIFHLVGDHFSMFLLHYHKQIFLGWILCPHPWRSTKNMLSWCMVSSEMSF